MSMDRVTYRGEMSGERQKRPRASSVQQRCPFRPLPHPVHSCSPSGLFLDVQIIYRASAGKNNPYFHISMWRLDARQFVLALIQSLTFKKPIIKERAGLEMSMRKALKDCV